MKIKIKSVDNYGYLGRDNHPSDADIGKIATVFAVESESYLDGVHCPDKEIKKKPEIVNRFDFYIVLIYHAVMEDGSIRCFVDEEVEVLNDL